MPPLSSLPDDLSRERLLNALRRLGFLIDIRGGNGSHCKITWPPTQKSVAIKKKTDKNTLNYILKQIKEASSITWEEIKEKL
jgi:hypothetical protein